MMTFDDCFLDPDFLVAPFFVDLDPDFLPADFLVPFAAAFFVPFAADFLVPFTADFLVLFFAAFLVLFFAAFFVLFLAAFFVAMFFSFALVKLCTPQKVAWLLQTGNIGLYVANVKAYCVAGHKWHRLQVCTRECPQTEVCATLTSLRWSAGSRSSRVGNEASIALCATRD